MSSTADLEAISLLNSYLPLVAVHESLKVRRLKPCEVFYTLYWIAQNVTTVEPLYYGHQGGRNKCPHYRGVRFREVAGFI